MRKSIPANQQLSTAILFLQQHMGRRKELVRSLKEDIQLTIPSNATYRTIVGMLLDKPAGKLFAEQFFPLLRCSSFADLCDAYTCVQGLSILWEGDFQSVVKWLRDHGKPGLLSRGSRRSRQDQANAILRESTPAECQAAIQSVATRDWVHPVRQVKRWVVGPLGVKLANVSRKEAHVEDLLRLLQRIPSHLLGDFARLLDLERELSGWGPRKLKPFGFNLFQATLVKATDEQILGAFNRLIAKRAITPERVEPFWSLVLTPFGVFPREHGGEDKLATLVQETWTEKELGIELAAAKLNCGSLPLRTLELCLSLTPEQVLQKFGNPQLREIGGKLGLEAVGSADRAELIEVLVWRLGFTRPPKLEGLIHYKRTLEECERDIRGILIAPNDNLRDGTMLRAYKATESILKDLLRFYVAFILRAQSRLPSDSTEQPGAVDEFAQTELKCQFPVADMTLGQLLAAMHTLDNMSIRSELVVNQLDSHFARRRILTEDVLAPAEAVLGKRKHFSHDVERTLWEGDSPDHAGCIEILANLKVFASRLERGPVYPLLVRVHRRVQDEYGREYLDVVDEDKREWRVKATDIWSVDRAFFMQPVTNPIAMHPLLMERLG